MANELLYKARCVQEEEEITKHNMERPHGVGPDSQGRELANSKQGLGKAKCQPKPIEGRVPTTTTSANGHDSAL